MSVSLRIDTREFAQVMREYVAVTGKDSAEAVNRQARNFAIKCISRTKSAKGAAAIKALQNESWWPKMIATIVGKQAGAKAASESFQAQWAAGEMPKHRKGAFKLDRKERSYAKYAKQLSRSILASRSAAITFLRFFFRTVATRMAQYSPSGTVPGGKAFPDMQTMIVPATQRNTNVRMESSYRFKRRGPDSAAGAERVLQAAMSQSISATIADMREYINRKLAQRAQQYSGRAT